MCAEENLDVEKSPDKEMWLTEINNAEIIFWVNYLYSGVHGKK